MTKFLNISTDTTLGGSSASDSTVSSQKAIKAYVDNHSGVTTLGGLSDVTISNPTAGQNLTYDATNQVWKNTSTSATVAWGGITGTLSDQTDLKNALDDKVTANTAITGATKCKITYDSKGLVTGGADLQVSDIPDISATYQTKITSSNKVPASNVSGLATVATSGKSSDLNNDAGFITGITSSDITTALGYTPVQYAMVITDYTA